MKIGCREAADFFCALIFLVLELFCYFCKKNRNAMEIKDYRISPWQWVAFIIVAAGLRILTGSFWMALGIFMLLLLIDFFIVLWDKKRRADYESSIYSRDESDDENDDQQEKE